MLTRVLLSAVLILATLPGCNQSSENSSDAAGASTNSTGSSSSTTCNLLSSKMVSEDQTQYLQSRRTTLFPNSFRKLQSHIPRAVRNLNDQGKLNDSQELEVTFALDLNHEDELDRKLAEMYTPGNANYHHFMNRDEFVARYSPTQDQVNQVNSYLKSQGITPVSTSSNRFFVHAKGPVAALNTMLQTEVHQYNGKIARDNNENKTYFSPAYELQIPSGISIRAVHGLQNVTHFKSHVQVKAHGKAKDATGPNGGYSPTDIRKAYNIPSSLTGSGQTLALFELDGFNQSDITQYETKFSLPAVPIQTILVDNASGSAGNGSDEVTLDIELMIAVAPGAKKILVYEGPNSEQGVLDTYAKIADDNLAPQVSTSWGASENQSSSSFIQSENAIFKQMAAQGQSIFAAAGDSGALDNGTSLSVDDPASQPYVVGVGGTQLKTNSNGSYLSETTWNATGKASDGAGGGGVSTIWTQPSWQSQAATSNTLGSTSMRNVPDVALNSDPETGYAIYNGGSWSVFGGTSCAAPLWAAFTALVNQQRASNGLTSLGFPNPVFYQIGLSNQYHQDFFDVADGSTNIHYPAVPGYDNATGWGSLNGQNLLDDLSQDLASLPTGAPQNSCGS